MITYTDFLESDVGSYILSYFKELMNKNDYIKEHINELERDTNIINKSTDDVMYDIYETFMGGIEQIEDEAMDYFDELESDINNGVYED